MTPVYTGGCVGAGGCVGTGGCVGAGAGGCVDTKVGACVETDVGFGFGVGFGSAVGSGFGVAVDTCVGAAVGARDAFFDDELAVLAMAEQIQSDRISSNDAHPNPAFVFFGSALKRWPSGSFGAGGCVNCPGC